MKKILGLFTAFVVSLVIMSTTDVEAAEITTYDSIVFLDEASGKYSYVLRKNYRDAVLAGDITQPQIGKYTHIQLGGNFYAKKDYRNFLVATGEFKKAINAALANGKKVTDIDFVEGKVEDGKVVSAEPVRFEVISIQ